MKISSLLLWVCLSIGTALSQAPQGESMLIENDCFRYGITRSARNVSFVDKATGKNYLRGSPGSFASVRLRGQEYPATSASLAEGRLKLKFGESGVEAALKVDARAYCVLLSVESLIGPGIDALTFLNVPLSLDAKPFESFGACALALNLTTRVDELPALQQQLRASAEQKFGIVGAKAAIVAGPMNRMLGLLQQTLGAASELPVCRVAGPWARETALAHGSYLFNFGSLTESNVTDWIQMARSVGFNQIDNHGGGEFFRFGDMQLNRQKWPDGWESWKRIVARLHGEGIGSIFHTYSFFIDKRSKYVTPVPDPRLDAFRIFALAEPLGAEDTEVTVQESTAGMSTITGFFEHNSVALHIGDELLTFGAVAKQPPWRFTQVKRGAFGTKAAAHERGSKARHLKECFGLFVPNPESSLFEEIAANHADVVNRCEFDGIYLDAIDGSSILRGGEECWYWANKFVVDIQRRLTRPVGMEMSAMWHQCWQYRTRWQAWDYPQRGHKRFVDIHAESVNGGLLLPLHLGWWNFQAWNPPQVEPTFPDVIENLGAKLVGWDAGISLTAGLDRKRLSDTPLFGRAAQLLKDCEELRHSKALDDSVRARLRETGKEFQLFTDAFGKKWFRRAESYGRKLSPAEPWSLVWTVTNRFGGQPLRFRLEALMSTAAPTVSNATVVADLVKERANWKVTSAEGVSMTERPVLSGGDWLELITTNSGKVPRNAAWLRWQKQFEPLANLKERQGLLVEVEGDGSGALLAIRLESPRHIAFGAVADRYALLDFTGRRTLSLVEAESSRWSDYVWNDNKGVYNVYRETIDFGDVESVSIWLQNLAPGRETQCRLSPLHALPLVTGIIRNPTVTLGDRVLKLPVELNSGSWVEASGPGDCTIYGPKGEELGKVEVSGAWPTLPAGVSEVRFSCDPVGQPAPRARLTVFTHGEPLS